ncbi:MAG TPA: flagellar export chaperone FliS [Gammaproteobacteria bacterium]|nr:flagellar export chaperone FliS [Gammaproteobacteria bacterium]
MLAKSALQEYQQVGKKAAVEDASPHRLIQMLMEGALEKIAAAKRFMEQGAIPEKGAHISWAVSIIDGLRASLDKSAGGEIALNLEELYLYMMRRLTEANLKNDPACLDEVTSLLVQIKSAWDAIAPEAERMEQERLSRAAAQGG